jgi:hypothetical protein
MDEYIGCADAVIVYSVPQIVFVEASVSSSSMPLSNCLRRAEHS